MHALSESIRAAGLFALLGALFAAALPAGAQNAPIGGPYEPDSATVLLMHFDGNLENAARAENGGSVQIAEPNGVGNLEEVTSEDFFSLMDLEGRDMGQQLHIDNELPEDSTFITIPDTTALDLTGSWTMEAWVLVRDFSQEHLQGPSLFFKPGSGEFASWQPNYFFNIYGRSEALRTGYWENTGSSAHIQMQSPDGSVQANEWLHLTFIRHSPKSLLVQVIREGVDTDGDDRPDEVELRHYATLEYDPIEAAPPQANGSPLYIGHSPGGNSGRLWAMVDEVRISNTVREGLIPGTLSTGGVARQDSLALVALYDSTGGDNWTNNDGWLSASVADWQGVTVSGDRAAQLDLSENQLTGTVPPELGRLSKLQELRLAGNQLTGAIPAELGQLGDLTVLDLASNQLAGPVSAELGQLGSLEVLHLQSNPLTGPIPLAFTNLTALNSFFFDGTDLCEPPDENFQEWLNGVDQTRSTGAACSEGPAPPSELSAGVIGVDNTVYLEWTESPSEDVESYLLYRDTTSAPTTRIKTIPAYPSTMDSTISASTTYYYRLTAVDSEGNESTYSNEVSVTTLDFAPPDPPHGLSAKAEDDKADLSWQPNEEADLARYRIYRDTKAGASTLVDSVSSASYTDDGLEPQNTYYYRLTAVDTLGAESDFSEEVAVATQTGVDEPEGVPETVQLQPAYPNPVSEGATIRFGLPKAGPATIILYDAQGREVRALLDGRSPAGWHEVSLDGGSLPSGVYFCRIEAAGAAQTRQVVILR